MNKITPRKKLIKKLDTVFSLYIRKRDKRCVICGTKDNLTCGHLITRAKYSVRWDEDNAFAQCTSCNMKHEYYPEIFTQWFIKTHRLSTYTKLIERSNKIRKFTNEDLIELCADYALKVELLN